MYNLQRANFKVDRKSEECFVGNIYIKVIGMNRMIDTESYQ